MISFGSLDVFCFIKLHMSATTSSIRLLGLHFISFHPWSTFLFLMSFHLTYKKPPTVGHMFYCSVSSVSEYKKVFQRWRCMHSFTVFSVPLFILINFKSCITLFMFTLFCKINVFIACFTLNSLELRCLGGFI